VSIVLDSSMALAWLFEDENSDQATNVLQQVTETGATVPSLWRLEVANALQMAVRRGRIDTAFRDASLVDLAALAIVIDSETDHQAWRTTLHLADSCKLTLYDAAYLELAQRLNLPLATLDQALANAAVNIDITLSGIK
jgi:predicted nucleic acid-binding protein